MNQLLVKINNWCGSFAIAKEIIEKHIGKISLSSIINEGTIVKIELLLIKSKEN